MIIDAMGQDQRQIMVAEDSENDFLVEFFPIKKGANPTTTDQQPPLFPRTGCSVEAVMY